MFCNAWFYLTVESLYSPDIVNIQLEALVVALVPGKHDCPLVTRVGQTQGMTKLMGSHGEKVNSWKTATWGQGLSQDLETAWVFKIGYCKIFGHPIFQD